MAGNEPTWPAPHDSAELRPQRRHIDNSERAWSAAVRIQSVFRTRAAELERAHADVAAKRAAQACAMADNQTVLHPRDEAPPADGFDSPPFELQTRFARRRPIGNPVEASVSISTLFPKPSAFDSRELCAAADVEYDEPPRSHSPALQRARAYGLSPDGARNTAGAGSAGAAVSTSFGTPPSASRGQLHSPTASDAKPSPRPSVCAPSDARPSLPVVSPHSAQASAAVRAPQSRRAGHASEEKLLSILAFLENAETHSGVAASRPGEESRASLPEPSAAGLLPPGGCNRSGVASSNAAARLLSTEQLSTVVPAAANEQAAGGTAASALYSGVKAKMASLKQQLADEMRRAAQLELELSACRQERARREAEAEAAAASRAEAARAEHEVALSRHLSFIDRLLADKAELARQVEALQAQSGALEAKFEQKLRAKDEAVAREVRRRAEALAVAEKAKREQWMAAKSKEIKELTIRGLEPDIQRLIEKHREEIRALSDSTRAAVAQAVAEERAACSRELKGASARAEEAVEKAVTRERIAASEAAERARAEAEAAARAARKAMLSELEEAREMHEASRRREAARHEAELREVRAAAEAQVADARASVAVERQGASESLQAERAALRREMEAERGAWLETQRAQMAAEAARREEQLGAAAAARRDAEVSKVISKLSEEMARTKREIEAAAQRRTEELIAAAQRDAQAARQEAAETRARAEQTAYLYEQLRSQLDRTAAEAADTVSERERLREAVRARCRTPPALRRVSQRR